MIRPALYATELQSRWNWQDWHLRPPGYSWSERRESNSRLHDGNVPRYRYATLARTGAGYGSQTHSQSLEGSYAITTLSPLKIDGSGYS